MKTNENLKIALFDAKPYDIRFFTEQNKKYNYYIKFFEYKLNEETAPLAKGFDVVCAFVNDDLGTKTIEALVANGITLIAMRAAGYNNVDFVTASGKIHIVRVPAYSPYAIAEHALAMILTLNRQTHRAFNRTRESNFSINGLMGFDLRGKTVGVIGTGKIGQVFIGIMKGMGMRVLAYDKYPNSSLEVEYTDLDHLFKESDIISLHCPLTDETYHMIDKDSIAKMKDGVMIINTSRGGLIHSEDLVEALKSRKVSSAGLDVYEEESEYFFEDCSDSIIEDDVLARLLSLSNVLVTSHQAFFTKEALNNIAEQTLENIRRFFTIGEEIINEVLYECDENGHCKVVTR
ncbi:2-hydroxyacid dehydrogenase [Clostridiales bacterium COT073_COT-073]|nr:2-hydroxyacid dehydrogenase [Clostridiales bacterium COT073_COT-073]